jgi:hypothetical protein
MAFLKHWRNEARKLLAFAFPIYELVIELLVGVSAGGSLFHTPSSQA